MSSLCMTYPTVASQLATMRESITAGLCPEPEYSPRMVSPPLRENYVLSVSATSLIDAPIERVWNAILDFKSYKLWNPFVRNQFLTDNSKNPLADQTVQVGKLLYMSQVNLPPTLDDSSVGMFNKNTAFCLISVLDHDDFKVAWETHWLPSWLLWTQRWQWLTEVDADLGDGKGRRKLTKYETIEVFGGLAAYFVKWFVGENLRLGFRAQAEGLKGWVEREL